MEDWDIRVLKILYLTRHTAIKRATLGSAKSEWPDDARVRLVELKASENARDGDSSSPLARKYDGNELAGNV